MPDTLDSLLTALVAGSQRHVASDAASRGALALATTQSVARCGQEWARVSLAIKQSFEPSARRGNCVESPRPSARENAAVLAEEISTGPLSTLRLLLITARSLVDIATQRLPRIAVPLRLITTRADGQSEAGRSPNNGPGSHVAVEVLPNTGLHDGVLFRNTHGVVRCKNPGGSLATFVQQWQAETVERPRGGGVAIVLGAGNVTGLAAADAICQIFEHGRSVLLKLHPLHAPLAAVLADALKPLIDASVLRIIVGGADLARAALAKPHCTHVHLTGGQAAFDAIVWGGPPTLVSQPLLTLPLTCELGNVTPWIVVPGRYTASQLQCQADTIAASIINNTSYNCIATKVVITCRSWQQREEFLSLIARRLAAQPRRPAWYPGSTAAWETLAQSLAPADGLLPWVFHTDVKPASEPQWLSQEWFLPVAAEIAIAAESLESFSTQALALTDSLPGSLAASVTAPPSGSVQDRQHIQRLLDSLGYGVVALNCWSALAYALGNVPWGGFPGATLREPQSGIGFVHNPLFLPQVHNSILRAPLVVWPKPPWFPWHTRSSQISAGVVKMYATIASGRSGTWDLAAMVPDVLRG
ncbi:MAG: hypothetical protein DWI25_03335 [Planctomycetota bacterium]|nr:MAG: hypothetical protein DWI25_03335 [Planctomycetota bacterium]